MSQVLVVLDQGLRLPSGYIRAFIYRDLLASAGYEPTFIDRQAKPRFVSIRSISNRLQRASTAVRERRILHLAKTADIVYLSKVTSLGFMRALRRHTKARLVLDLCDAVWLMDGYIAAQFSEVVGLADAVTTDNEFTAYYLRDLNSNCTVVPDPSQVEEFDKRRAVMAPKRTDRVVVGWLGSPATVFNLYVIWEALEEVSRRHPHVHLRLVGTGHDSRLLPPFERVRFSQRHSYDQSQMVKEVFGMHIGLFPLQDVEKCRVRGINKAAIYMAGEAVVVASDVGQCREFIHDGVNGMLARTTEQWIDKLDALICDEDLRRRLAASALGIVQSQLRTEHCFARLTNVLRPPAAPTSSCDC